MKNSRHLSRLLIHPLGTVEIDREAPDRAHLVVKPCPGMFSPQTSWTTAYPDDLIELILEVKGPAWLVDGQGLCLFAKRLERGRFIWLQARDGTFQTASIYIVPPAMNERVFVLPQHKRHRATLLRASANSNPQSLFQVWMPAAPRIVSGPSRPAGSSMYASSSNRRMRRNSTALP